MMFRGVAWILFLLAASACSPDYDVILRKGTVYDGSGGAPIIADVGIADDTIAAIGDLSGARGSVFISYSVLGVKLVSSFTSRTDNTSPIKINSFSKYKSR